MRVDAVVELGTRVSLLDAPTDAADVHTIVDPDIARFIRVMSRITPSGTPAPQISPGAADTIVGRSRLIQRLRRREPALIDGPLSLGAQHWVATGRPEHLSRRVHLLDRTQFDPAETNSSNVASTKPIDLGLYTATGIFDSYGMWWDYLQLHEGSTLFPLPWTVWALEISTDARILELRTASEWARFISENGVEERGLFYPDWTTASNEWDGVHMTLSAVAATQGVELLTPRGHIAPSYWDVESTLWLRWVFSAERIERVRVSE